MDYRPGIAPCALLLRLRLQQKFASIIEIFDNVVPPPADQSEYSLWYVDWEWEIHRSTEDVVKVLRQMADLCLEQGFSGATE